MIYFPISQVTAMEIASFARYQLMTGYGLAKWDALTPEGKNKFIPDDQDTWGNPLAHISRALGWGPGPGPGLAPGPGPGPGAILGPGARGSCQGPGPGANAAPQEMGEADIKEVCRKNGSFSQSASSPIGFLRFFGLSVRTTPGAHWVCISRVGPGRTGSDRPASP